MIHFIGNKSRIGTRFLFLAQYMGIRINYEKSLAVDSNLNLDIPWKAPVLVTKQKQRHYHKFTKPYGYSK